jgi:PAS domain S-box-containing protein
MNINFLHLFSRKKSPKRRLNEKELLLQETVKRTIRQAVNSEQKFLKMVENEKMLVSRELQASEKRFSDFIENSPFGTVIVDGVTLKFKKWNSMALELLKVKEDDIREKGIEMFLPEFQPDNKRSDQVAFDYINQALVGLRPSFEFTARSGEGKLLTFEVQLVALNSGSSPEICATFTDITSRKSSEKELDDHNRRLSEIAFIQSHQMRQPLATLMGLISLFNFHDLNDPRNVEVLSRVEEACRSFDGIIKKVVLKAEGKRCQH